MAGRSSKYESHVKPFLSRIEKLLNDGASEKQIAKSLGVSYATFNNYKNLYPELRELCSKPRTRLIDDLRSALIKRAKGFTYEEKKKYIVETDDGVRKMYTEITTKYALPDVAAINLALKNYDRDNWANDPQMLDLKRQELELRERMAEKDDW